MPVRLFVQKADFRKINAIAQKYKNPVIEDAEQSVGALHNGMKSCAVTKISSTSFFPAKPLGCYGDGGAFFTDDDQLAHDMKAIRMPGGVAKNYHTLVRTNGRFNTLQAAIVIAKLPEFDWEVQQRNRLGALYTQLLGDACITPTIVPGCSVLKNRGCRVALSAWHGVGQFGSPPIAELCLQVERFDRRDLPATHF